MIKYNTEKKNILATYNKNDFVIDMSESLNISREKSSMIIGCIISIIKENIQNNKILKIKNFGKFKLISKKERMARNPKTLEPFKIEARDVVTFGYATALKEYISSKNYHFYNGNYSSILSENLLIILEEKGWHIDFNNANNFINAFFNFLTHNLIRRNRIELRSFGVFEIRKYRALKARNPKTGEIIFKEKKELPFFKYSKNFVFRKGQLK